MAATLVLPVWQPDGKRTRRGLFLVAGLFSFGTGVGGVLTGALLALVLWPIAATIPPALGAGLAVLVSTAVMVIRQDRLPQRRKLIPRERVYHRSAGGIFGFGVEYGTGFRTFVPSVAPYLLLVSVVLLGPQPRLALGTCTVFGLARSLHLWAAVTALDPRAFLVNSEVASTYGAHMLGPAFVGLALVLVWATWLTQ